MCYDGGGGFVDKVGVFVVLVDYYCVDVVCGCFVDVVVVVVDYY